MIRPLPWALSVLFVAFVAPPPEGIAYDVRQSAIASGDSPLVGALQAQASEWAGSTRVLNGRGRMDVLTGGQAPMFSAGDYLLFDGNASIVIRPSTRSALVFVLSDMKIDSVLAARGVHSTTDSVVATLDSIGGPPARQFVSRLSYVSVTSFDDLPDEVRAALVSASRTQTTLTTTYWYGDSATSPMPRLGGPTPSFLSQGPIGAALSRLAVGLPRNRRLLKQTTITELRSGDRAARIERTFETSHWRKQVIDPRDLVLPADYKVTTLDGGAAPDSAFRRWTVPPR